MSVMWRDDFFRPSIFDTDPWFQRSSFNSRSVPVHFNSSSSSSSAVQRNWDMDFKRFDDEFEQTVRRNRERMEASMREFEERVAQSRARMNEMSRQFHEKTSSRRQRRNSFDSSMNNVVANNFSVNTQHGGDRDFSLRMNLPKNIDPSHIHVAVEGGDIVVKAEEKIDQPNYHSSASFYHRATLPPNADINAMKAFFENNQLSISAPTIRNNNYNNGGQTIPIKYQ